MIVQRELVKNLKNMLKRRKIKMQGTAELLRHQMGIRKAKKRKNVKKNKKDWRNKENEQKIYR